MGFEQLVHRRTTTKVSHLKTLFPVPASEHKVRHRLLDDEMLHTIAMNPEYSTVPLIPPFLEIVVVKEPVGATCFTLPLVIEGNPVGATEPRAKTILNWTKR